MRARDLIALAVAVAAACRSSTPPPPAAHDDGSGRYGGRPIAQTMSYLGADWLDREDRSEREQPDKVIAALHVAEGQTVADLGAGTGFFTIRLARAVGEHGSVIATDLQPEMLRLLDARLVKEHIHNVELRRGGDRDANLPRACCDLVLLVDVYHELADPPAIMAGVRHALRERGRLVLIEYRAEDPKVAIKPEHKMTLAQVRKELEPMGFRFVDSLEFLADQHVIVFTRDDAPP